MLKSVSYSQPLTSRILLGNFSFRTLSPSCLQKSRICARIIVERWYNNDTTGKQFVKGSPTKKASTIPVHFNVKSPRVEVGGGDYSVECGTNLPHPAWSEKEVYSVSKTHYAAKKLIDKLAFGSVKCLRFGFDLISGYSLGLVNETGWINRIIFLETVAGVPGMVGAGVRHLRSLRRMEKDYGWIHTLLEEAENERMHLMSALEIKRPGYLFRLFVLLTQGVFLPMFTLAYLLSPQFAHRFVGYLEEEAVVTYSKLLHELDSSRLPGLANRPASRVAKIYWQLPSDALFKHMILAIRADESHHRDVNHTFANLNPTTVNPFPPGH